jgi:hypothetical protein
MFLRQLTDRKTEPQTPLEYNNQNKFQATVTNVVLTDNEHRQLLLLLLKVKQSRYRPGVAEGVPGS